jgi:O-antigen/teichoic acid export membrane protein
MSFSFRKLDSFFKSVVIVFVATSAANFLFLITQLYLAHSFTPADFAAFNAVISLFLLVSSPLSCLQQGIAHQVAVCGAEKDAACSARFFTSIMKTGLGIAAVVLLLGFLCAPLVTDALKIPQKINGYLLMLLIAITCVKPLMLGAVQGIERFFWLAGEIFGNSLLRLLLTFAVVGWGVAGGIAPIAIAASAGMIYLWFPLRSLISRRQPYDRQAILSLGKYLLPLMTAAFCYMALISLDMVLVKYFFPPDTAGTYSLAQMVGKIFVFLPASVTIVMFPKTAGLHAKKLDTFGTLLRSLKYMLLANAAAFAVYNFFPDQILTVLTGKHDPLATLLGRYFSLSMTFFAMANALIFYFLSLANYRFIPFLLGVVCLDGLAVICFHASLLQVQRIQCAASGVLLAGLLAMVLASRRSPSGETEETR